MYLVVEFPDDPCGLGIVDTKEEVKEILEESSEPEQIKVYKLIEATLE